MGFQNYIFDFGQVIVRFDPAYMTAACVKDPEQIALLKDVVFDRLYWDELDAGTMSDEEAKAAFCSRLPDSLHSTACRVYDHWLENLPLIDGMYDLLLQIKAKGGKLFLLSNISKGFAEKYIHVPQLTELFSLFDGLVFSGPLGIIKPDKAIFEYLLDTYALTAETCCFIDDNPGNVAGAERAGITGFVFRGDAEALRNALLCE